MKLKITCSFAEVLSEEVTAETVTPEPSQKPKCVLLSFNNAKKAFSLFFKTDASAAFKRCQQVTTLKK